MRGHMVLTGLRFATLVLALAIASPAVARHWNAPFVQGRGLDGTTILIIRHAEKPSRKKRGGPGLAEAGDARAQAYATYFRNFRVNGAPAKIDTLVAAADSRYSIRPRRTLEPLGRATGLPVQQPFADEDVKKLAGWLAEGAPNRVVLIAWHQGKIPKLLAALGADPASLLPGGTWPEETYDWVIVLRFDPDGRLSAANRLVEPGNLVPPERRE